MNHEASLVSKDFIRRHIGIPLIPYALGVSLLAGQFVAGQFAYADSGSSLKPALIVPKGGSDKTIQAESQPESFESYQIRILRNQNQLQAEKIKVLREELAEVSQKLHELKPRLFAQSDPSDQQKIATLSEKLREKEELANQLTAAKTALERDFATVRKKLTEMETVKEALTAMIEKQRLAKDQSHTDFKKQLEEIRTTAANEKNSLLKSIQQHETTHEQLQAAVAAKTQDVSRLDEVATRLNVALTAKHEDLLALEARLLAVYHEMLSMSETHALKENATQDHVQTLTTVLEKNRKENRELRAFREEMKWLADLFNGSHAILSKQIDQLSASLNEERGVRTELQQIKGDLETQYKHLAKAYDENDRSRQDAFGQIQTLSAALESSQKRTEDLEQELAVLLSHQDAGQEYSDKLEQLIAGLSLDSAAQLASEREVQRKMHEEHEQRLASEREVQRQMQEEHEQRTGSLLNHLEGATLAREESEAKHRTIQDQWQAQEAALKDALRDTVLDAAADQLAHRQVADDYVQKTETLLHHLATASTDLDAREADNRELLSQLDSAKNLYLSREGSLKDNLHEAFANYEKSLEKNAELARALQQSEERAVGLEEELALRHYALMAQEGQALELEAQHEAAVRSLESQLSELNGALSQEAQRSTHLESLLQQAAALAENQAANLAEHRVIFAERLAEAHQQQHEHTGAVAVLENQVSGLRDNLETQTGLTHHLALEVNRKNEELNQRLRDYKLELDDKEAALKFSQQTLEQVKGDLTDRLDEITNALQQERSQANELKAQLEHLTQEYENADKHKHELEALIRDLSHDLSEKQQMLALAQDKAATTDYDNQSLAKHNRDLLEQHTAAQTAHLEALDIILAHATALEDLKEQLKSAHETSKDALEMNQQLSILKRSLAEKEERIAALEETRAAVEREREAEVKRLEQTLATERNQRALAERDLQYARMNYTAERRSLLNLEQIARESMNKNVEQEKALSEALKKNGTFESDLGLLTLDKQEFERDLALLSHKLEEVLEQEKILKAQFQEELAAAKQQHDERVQSLEAEIAALDLDKVHNRELLAENQRLVREKYQLEMMLIEQRAKDSKVNEESALEKSEGDEFARTRLQRINELKSNQGSVE